MNRSETGGFNKNLSNSLLLMILTIAGILLFPAFSEAARRQQKSDNSEPVLRVKMGGNHTKFSVKFPDGGWLENSRGRKIKTFRKNEVFSWELPASGKNRSRTQYRGETIALHGNNSLVQLDKNLYRGYLQAVISDKGARIINHVGIESYLRGVVGSEIGSMSPVESLRAQTVIARTYAYASRGKHGSEGADVCDSTHCQVYSGVKAERAAIDPAVKATRGIIMISDGEPIATLYHASCGGMTSDNDKVFGGAPRSYLRRVICPFCKDGHNYRWTRSIKPAELTNALRREKIVFSKLYDAEIDAPANMDRVTSIILHTDTGTHKVRGTTFRRLFNLPSTTFLLGNRSRAREVIAAAAPVKTPVNSQLMQHTTLRIAALVDDAGDGPNQLMILTESGLKRTLRPAEGWQTIGLRLASREEAESSSSTLPSATAATKGQVQANRDTLNELQLFGRGYGHQVGLCQAGTIEMGKRNWSYRQILAFYYSNVALRSLDY
ncbi:MAG: SpoIID/LytB domain-containing protein [Candidatus Riflebacteria bacterium]|nr:SpoIID/LytB domain-containing protein [Candidatus Riflebacteria bacterium]